MHKEFRAATTYFLTIPFNTPKMSFRKTDHISYRKPGPNHIEDGVLVIPASQIWGEFFSFRSASGAIIRDMPIDLNKATFSDLANLAEAMGSVVYGGAKRVSAPGRRAEIIAQIQAHLRIDAPEALSSTRATATAAPFTTAQRTALQSSLLEEEQRQLREKIPTLRSDLSDIEETIPYVKPSIVAILQSRATGIRALLPIYEARAAEIEAELATLNTSAT